MTRGRGLAEKPDALPNFQFKDPVMDVMRAFGALHSPTQHQITQHNLTQPNTIIHTPIQSYTTLHKPYTTQHTPYTTQHNPTITTGGPDF